MGHVPEENLPEYRRRRDFARRIESLGNTVSGLANGQGHGIANQLWSLAAEVVDYANELRT